MVLVKMNIVCALILSTAFKAYMDWGAITNTESMQYQLMQQCTVSEEGFVCKDGKPCVALAETFGQVGDTVIITLENQTFLAVVGDIKKPYELEEGLYHRVDEERGNVLEFIVDTRTMRQSDEGRQALRDGDVSCMGYEGEVLKIYRVDTGIKGAEIIPREARDEQ